MDNEGYHPTDITPRCPGCGALMYTRECSFCEYELRSLRKNPLADRLQRIEKSIAELAAEVAKLREEL